MRFVEKVLEYGDGVYGAGSGTQVKVLTIKPDPSSERPFATICKDNLVDLSFDCIMVSDLLEYVFDASDAIATLCRLLRPGGPCRGYLNLSSMTTSHLEIVGDLRLDLPICCFRSVFQIRIWK